jgi:hypothetical protein
MNDRTKAIVMIFGLSHQLNAWLEYARSFGYMTQRFKQDSAVLSKQCEKFNQSFGAMEEEVYEHSVKISELFERIAKLDDFDINRVIGIVEKIEKSKLNNNERVSI